MKTFALAPMSGPIRVITVSIQFLALGFIALTLAGLAPTSLLIAGVLVWVLDVVVYFACRPTEFQVGERRLTTVWPVRRKQYPLDGLTAVQVVDVRAFRARFGTGLRVGVGGLFGGFGWLYMTKGGWVEMDLSRTEEMVLLEWSGRIPLLVTPERTAAFVEAVRGESGLG